MSVTLTSGSEHFSTLINALRDDVPNIKVYCYDGEMAVSAILLASVCPTIRDIGKDETNLADGNEINLILPDYSISNFKFFAQMLASTEGPVLSEDELFISQTLLFLGYDFKCGDGGIGETNSDNHHQQQQQHYVEELLHDDDDSEKWLARSNEDYEDVEEEYPQDEETNSCQEESNLMTSQIGGDNDLMSQKTTRSFKSKTTSAAILFFVMHNYCWLRTLINFNFFFLQKLENLPKKL